MDERILDKMLNIAERFFGTAADPDQMPVTRESFYKLQRLHPKTVIYRLENGEPVSWIVVLPTSAELMNKFLKSEITERELLDLSEPKEIYEALYLCATFTVPEHRRKGYVVQMFGEAVNSIPHSKDAKLFAWPFSEAGKKLNEKLKSVLGQEILTKT